MNAIDVNSSEETKNGTQLNDTQSPLFIYLT